MPLTIDRPQGTITSSDVTNRNTQRIKLDRGPKYREIWLRHRSSIAVTTDSTHNVAAKIAGRCGEYSLIESLSLVANGSRVLMGPFSGAELFWLNWLWYRTCPNYHRGLGGGTTYAGTALAIDNYIGLPLWNVMGPFRMDTLLDSGLFNQLEIVVTFAPTTTLGLATDYTNSGQAIDVHTMEADGPDGAFSLNEWSRTQTALDQNHKQQIDLPLNNGIYRGLFVNTIVTASGADIPFDMGYAATFTTAGVSNFKVTAGQTVRYDKPAGFVRQQAHARFGLPNFINRTTALAGQWAATTLKPIPPITDNALTDVDAWGYINFLHDGRTMEGIDTAALGSFKLEVDSNGTSGTNSLVIIPDVIYPANRIAR